jgi:hypothetical protein
MRRKLLMHNSNAHGPILSQKRGIKFSRRLHPPCVSKLAHFARLEPRPELKAPLKKQMITLFMNNADGSKLLTVVTSYFRARHNDLREGRIFQSWGESEL